MKRNGPPRPIKKYPGIYESNAVISSVTDGLIHSEPNPNRRLPNAKKAEPTIAVTRGPYLSRTVPIVIAFT
jgi:hypothetical protein